MQVHSSEEVEEYLSALKAAGEKFVPNEFIKYLCTRGD